ncbi:MAG: hypothetical protein KDD44_08470, partial [Bdellovibrionales bacterium]|nr:hypothetical protein [Bdellovibrionales bacterium]
MLWLKRFDGLARFSPRWALTIGTGPARSDAPVLVRPGGLGDLVLLTRAMQQCGYDVHGVRWIVEKRNAPWLSYLGIHHACYDSLTVIAAFLQGRLTAPVVVNTEQTFGLSTLFARRLAGRDGQVVGYSSNVRSDLYHRVVHYDRLRPELLSFADLLQVAAQQGARFKRAALQYPEF